MARYPRETPQIGHSEHKSLKTTTTTTAELGGMERRGNKACAISVSTHHRTDQYPPPPCPTKQGLKVFVLCILRYNKGYDR